MAAEPEPQSLPPEPPPPPLSAQPPAAETTADPTTSAPTAAPPTQSTKRQRRPSVRLGEIGDHRESTHEPEHHARRSNIPPWSWRTPKEPSRNSSKNRPLSNPANGAEAFGTNNEFGSNHRRGKAKRGGSTTKRLRSNHTPRNRTTPNENDDAFGDFDHDHDHDHDERTVHSVHDDYWHMGRHVDRARVSENDVVVSDSRKCEGVRSWLFELGLSRYAPMFEIHEVDDELLPMLTLEDLKDMGINAVGSRRKMYTAIQKLRKGIQ